MSAPAPIRRRAATIFWSLIAWQQVRLMAADGTALSQAERRDIWAFLFQAWQTQQAVQAVQAAGESA